MGLAAPDYACLLVEWGVVTRGSPRASPFLAPLRLKMLPESLSDACMGESVLLRVNLWGETSRQLL